ncbi:probable aspartyl protease At4g16563 [Salvia miltiorrhiza]|uniref:probable aspartyl protease At4g16563 n=1 Tax=Salvia miltiorrhiza TaxID=226208 RepID=UPI0025ACC20A|nr:probable aspartyl protease At4g16563 [Salvia miltiorrhiza]
MSSSSLPLLPLFSLISLFSLSSAYTTTLSLSPTAEAPPHANPWQRLAHLASASFSRAHHLKQPKSNLSASRVPLFPRGYGGYSISLSFGTPPQTSSFIMDTGSSLLWFPCTQRYSCNSCNFADIDPANITTFIPKSSSTAKIVGCKNPKCKWIFPNVRCRECDKSCNQACPPYIIQYGSGSTTGLLLSDSLVLPDQKVENFVVGCSIFSNRQPAGIAGFGRGPESLPAQMKLKLFSYCLVSHRFDGKPVSSDLVLDSGGGAAGGGGIKYTPFRKNPASSNAAFQDYYYVTLRKITVGGVKVKAPYKFLVPDSDGRGGTIVDSGTTFTYMEKEVFSVVAEEFEKQIGKNYSRAAAVEKESGLRPCYNISGEKTVDLPRLTFHFKGGAKMALPLADYFSFVDESVICITIVSSSGMEDGIGPGPAIILGNYQQQNFYLEYDLENERLGFRSQRCK